jgi:hypothetical protein
MNLKTRILSLGFMLLTAIAVAEPVVLIKLPSGQILAGMILVNGQPIYFTGDSVTSITIGDTPDPTLPPSTTKVDRVTYVYEKDQGGVPVNVQVALAKINEGRKILASEFEDDTVDGDGDVPDQYKIALEQSKTTGIPCLVVQSGTKVVRVVKITKTTTLNEIMEAVK